MGTPIIPAAGDPPPAGTGTGDGSREGGKIITCEGCGSRVDRRGNLIKRGERLREALDSEDTVAKLRKDLAKATETIAEKDSTIAELRSQIKPEKKSILKREI
jgi:hypothetical protein